MESLSQPKGRKFYDTSATLASVYLYLEHAASLQADHNFLTSTSEYMLNTIGKHRTLTV